MKNLFTRIFVAQACAAVTAALALKAFYSTANVNELWWILGPTAYVVEIVTGERFTFEAYAGYINNEHSFIIASSCSGVNFLISAFLMLTIGRLLRHGRVSWSFLPLAAAVTYLTTIVANTIRITTALGLRRSAVDIVWIHPDQLHRFEGILIYFGFLVLLFVFMEKVDPSSRKQHLVPAHRRYIFPLLIYYATTLGIPLVNAIYRGTGFGAEIREHLLIVLIIPALITSAIALCGHFIRRKTPEPYGLAGHHHLQ
jgi:exosortase K